MRLSSNFITGARDERDRIRKQRKENREAFEKFKQLKVENGEQVTAEEFQQYRNSLSGGDAFFTRPWSGELDDLAKEQTNALCRQESWKTQSLLRQIKQYQKHSAVGCRKFGHRPTNKEAAKENFMMNFEVTKSWV